MHRLIAFACEGPAWQLKRKMQLSAAAIILPISLISALLPLVTALHQDQTLPGGFAAKLCVFVATRICGKPDLPEPSGSGTR